jgi:Domain of unknown function (DUF1906)
VRETRLTLTWFSLRSPRLPASLLAGLCGATLLFFLIVLISSPAQDSKVANPTYLGFDANDYPGDTALPRLRKTFMFAGYWLNNPPGANSNSWIGHRDAIAQQGFGFLVLFNGRLERELKSESNARALGASDARAAAEAARHEGFVTGTVIFLDQEEGGSMDAAQLAYLLAWFDGIAASGFHSGIYCSGMPASEGHGEFTITANFIRDHAGARKLVYFVYNDACPPSPGCAYANAPPRPSSSGVSFASVWQFAQSPRRREFTRRCAATYNADGRCYPPEMGPGSPYIDIESATSPDPSHAGIP